MKTISTQTGVLIAVGCILVSIAGCCGIFAWIGSRQPKQVLQTNINMPPSPTSTLNENKRTSTPKPTPKPFDYERDGLELVKAKWSKGGFGSVALWTVTIKNISDKPLGDIKFNTVYNSESGNIVGKGGVDSLLGKDTIQKIVPPKTTRTFEVNDGFISDEAVTARFDIVSWRIIQ